MIGEEKRSVILKEFKTLQMLQEQLGKKLEELKILTRKAVGKNAARDRTLQDKKLQIREKAQSCLNIIGKMGARGADVSGELIVVLERFASALALPPSLVSNLMGLETLPDEKGSIEWKMRKWRTELDG